MTTTTLPAIHPDAVRDLGDWGSNWVDDYEEPHSPKHYAAWLKRVARGQTPVESLHPDVREFFEQVRDKKFDWDYDGRTGEDNPSTDWNGIITYSREGNDSLRAITWESDEQIANFILNFIIGYTA